MVSHHSAAAAVRRLAVLADALPVAALVVVAAGVLVAAVVVSVVGVADAANICPIASTDLEAPVPESGNPGLMVRFHKTGATLSVLARAVAVAEKVELHRELVRALGPFVEHELLEAIQSQAKTSLESDEFTTGNTHAGADEQLRTQQGTAD